MFAFRLALSFLLAISQSITFASPIVAARGPYQGRAPPPVHRRPNKYRPVHPSALSAYENRNEGRHDVGDFVMHGLGGLMKMVTKQYGLRRSESFFWGPAGNPLANLTAYVGDQNVRMLSMERFENVLDDTRCSKNTIKFKFNKEVSFDQVQKEWQWINDAYDNYIVLVTENARCNAPDGDRTSRQPWHVKTAAFDDETNTVTLSAVPRTWDDAFSSWHLKIDSQGLTPYQRLRKRDSNETYDLPLAASLPSTPLEFTDDDEEVTASIACSECYTTGSLHFVVDVDWDWSSFSLGGTVTMTPNDLSAHITVDLTAQGTEEADHTIELWTWDADPFDILGITIGPAFKIDLTGSLEANAEIDLSAGAVISIPPDAVAVLDVGDSSNNRFSGWTPVVTYDAPGPGLTSEISITATAALVLRAEFDLQVAWYGVGAGLALQAPVLSITASEAFDTSGDVCGVAGANFGVDLDVSLGVELDMFAGVGKAVDMPNEQTIYEASWDIFSACLPVPLGLPGGSSSALPSAPSSAASGYPSASSYPSSSSAAPSVSAYAQPSSSSGPSSSRAEGGSAWPSSSSGVASSYPTPSSSHPALLSSPAAYAAPSSTWR